MTVKVHVHVKIQNKTRQYDENNVVLLPFGFRVMGSEGRACNIASGNGTSPGACGLRGCSGAAAVYASRAAPAHDSRHVPRISAAAAPPQPLRLLVLVLLMLIWIGRERKKPRAPRSSCSPSNGTSAPPSPHARNGGAFSYAGTSGRPPPAARFHQISTGTAGTGTGRRTRTQKTARRDRRTKGVYEATPTPTPRARQSDSAAPRLRQHAHPPRCMTVPEPRVGALPAPTLPTAQIPPRTNETPPQCNSHKMKTTHCKWKSKKKRKKATDERDRCRYDEHGHRGQCRVATKEHHRDHDARGEGRHCPCASSRPTSERTDRAKENRENDYGHGEDNAPHCDRHRSEEAKEDEAPTIALRSTLAHTTAQIPKKKKPHEPPLESQEEKRNKT
ncbi:hypothetical protein C8J57DRAFT_1240773 [Mycena rebaudengoi]|nr:hypothetical protein C8J57DRAFT_1240773 [Mycena rebaudengoi]